MSFTTNCTCYGALRTPCPIHSRFGHLDRIDIFGNPKVLERIVISEEMKKEVADFKWIMGYYKEVINDSIGIPTELLISPKVLTTHVPFL